VPRSGLVLRWWRALAVVLSAVLLTSLAEVVVEPPPAAAAPAPPTERVGSRPDRASAALAARAQGSRVKVDGAGSAWGETFANPDGSLTAETYTAPSFRRDGAGRDGAKWVPLTAALSGSGSAGDPFVADGLARRVTFGPVDRLLAVDVPGGSVSFAASGLRLGAPTRSGLTVTYPDAATDTDLQLVVTPGGVKTNLVLRSASAPRSYRFHLSDPRGLVGSPEQLPDGSFRFSRDLGDGYHLGLTAATAYQPSQIDPEIGPGVDRSSASQTVTRAGDGWDITLAVDSEWLAGKAFPVVLDPSPTFVAGGPGTPGVDCHLVSGTSASTSFCVSDWREVGFNTAVSKIERTLVMFGMSTIPANAVVSSADLDLYLYSTNGPTGAVPVRAHRVTSGWNQGATWNANGGGTAWAGGAYDSGTTLATTNVGLAAGHYHWALTPGAVQNWISGAAANYGVLLKVVSETTHGVLRFNSAQHADASRRPRLTITYNVTPGRPAGRSVQPCASQCASPVATTSLTPQLTAQSSDPDGSPLDYTFEVYQGATMVTSGTVTGAPPSTLVRWRPPSGVLSAGVTYQYRVRAWDGTAYSAWSDGWTQFTVDTVAPPAPTLSSANYANNGWGGPAAGTISFASTDPPGTAVTTFSTQLDDEEWTPFAAGSSRALSGLTQGRHTFAVRAQDKAGNISTTTTWTLGVDSGGIDTPKVEERTAARVTLGASAPAGRDWLTWKYLLGSTGAFTTVPLADVTVPGTSTHPASWPVQRSAGVLPPLVWDLATTAGPDGLVQVQACFGTSAADPSPFCTTGRNVQLSRAAGSSASTGAGPGSVSLLTGDLTVSESDVDVPTFDGSLTVGRTLTTLNPSAVTAGATGVFGPAWTASMPGPEAGAADLTVVDKASSGYFALAAEDGTQDLYVQQSVSGTKTTYAGIGEAGAEGATLVRDTLPTPDTLTLTDLDDSRTVWSQSGTTWGITSITEAGGLVTTYTRDGNGRITQIVGPVPDGVTGCTTDPLTTTGCRTLTLTYATTTTATGSTFGKYTGRLDKVAFTAYDPDASPAAMRTVDIAAYNYDSTGMLREAWDPRIAPALKTAYTYIAANRLATVTPPGLSAWTVNYDGSNRVTTVTRPNPTGGTQTTTIRYGVPFTGAGAPVDLGSAQTAQWGQADLPTTATAVWGPDRVPAASPSTLDWQYAELSYLDVNGRPVNTATWGASTWQVTTSEYDRRGNTVRTLSAGNRNDALNPAGNPDLDPYVASVTTSAARAELLSDITVYSADGVDEIASYGPMHPVILHDGTLVSAREHTTTTYDEGAPTAGLRLPTTSVTAALTPDGVDKDARTIRTGYDPVGGTGASGWDLRQPTSTRTVIDGTTTNDIIKYTKYNPAGQVIETRMPSDSGGGGAGTNRTVYYTTTANATHPQCGGVAPWAGLLCLIEPVGQPATGPVLPTTRTTYTIWDAPKVVTETVGATTLRTTTTIFDGAGRSTGQSVTASTGTAIPDVTTGYSPTTGLPTTTTTTADSITVGYDAAGQATSYTQTAGGTTVTSATRTYDLAGRVATVYDGKGTTTYSYDSATDHRGNTITANDTLAGATIATYDADGDADTLQYPGGLIATTTDDNAGNDTRLTYTKSGTTWMTFTQTESIHGQIRTSTGPLGRQLNTYDPAARLTRVDDNTGATCTRRDYTFDKNTNRTAHTTTVGTDLAIPAPTTLCDLTGATPTTVTSSYDTADRLTATGITYDALGRTTALPAGAVTGGAALTVGYATNDMVAMLTQSGRTKTYTLDPARRVGAIADTAGPTLTNHYTDGSDDPAWISTSSTDWSRYLVGASGGLALTVDNAGTVILNLPNLHGDIVATAAPSDTGPATYTETTEYGLPRDPGAIQSRYGWLGSHRRNTGDALAQITLMGVRLYNPTIGRFLSLDPVPGGSCNDYDYTCADPVNATDLDGRKPWYKRNWGKRLDRLGTGLAVAGLLGCGPCAAAAAVISLGRGAYKIAHGDRSGWVDLAGSGTYGTAKGLRYGSKLLRKYRMKRYPKGMRGKARYNKSMRRKAAASNRHFNRRYSRRADRIDRTYGVANLGYSTYGEISSYRRTRSWAV
jgi:RHS repeat-associated protein